MYQEKPTAKENMKERIKEAIQSLSATEILLATNSFPKRVAFCIQQNEANFEHLN